MARRIAVVVVVAVLLVSAVGPAAAQPEANGTVSISANPASDGSNYGYVLNNASEASNLSVELEGIENVVEDSRLGTLSSGTPESVDIVSDQPPQNETITLSAPYEERSRSKTGTITGSRSVAINPSGSLSVSNSATVSLSNAQSDDVSQSYGSDWGIFEGATESETFSTDSTIIDSITVRARENDNAYTPKLIVHADSAKTQSTEELSWNGGSQYGTRTFDSGDLPMDVGQDPTLYFESTGDTVLRIDEIEIDFQGPESVTVDGDTISPSGSTNVPISTGSQSIPISLSNGGKVDYEISWTETDGIEDLSGTVGSTPIDESGSLTSPITRSVDLSDGSNSVDLSYAGESDTLDYNLSWDETTETSNPEVSINGQTVGYTGVLGDGETKSLTVSDEWLTSGRNQVTISTDSTTGGPESIVGLNYRHDASRTITTTATSTQFESNYNVSHTYRNATEDATVLLPFDSGRVVDVHTLDYRLNDGSWKSMAAGEYRVNRSEITADISEAEGGELPQDTTVDVRATGRKIEVENGAVEVTEATAPSDELDTQLRIDSKSEGFQINVGPTVSGSRVHYGLSDDFGGSGPDGSAVIEANGDQHVQFPNALAGDSVRMKHLKTQVMPQSGDVRIDVKEAGSDPKIDVSPGPGGEGDPVDIKYYRTQTGQQYILESLTQGIVIDDDVAESPAVFSDDDSEETWLIGLGSIGGDGSTESDNSGIIGPVQTNSGFEIPFGGPLPALAALLGVGLTAAVYWSGRDGFGTLRRVGSRAGSATRSSIPVIGGVLGRLVSGLLTLLSLGGSGLVQLAQFLRARPTLGTLVTVGLVLASVVSGVVPVPQGTTIAIFAVAVPLVSFVVLRRLDEFSPLVWGATSAIGLIVSLVLLGVEFGGLINEQTSLILVVGGLYLAYRAVQAYREGNITNVVIPGRRGGDGQ